MKKLLYILWVALWFGCTPKKGSEPIELPFYSEETFSAEWIDEGDPRYANIHTISDFEFVNQEGEKVTNETFDGKVYVANFFFTLCPTVCPKMEANLSLVQEEFKGNDQVKILSHTVMPWADSVDRLKEYAIQNEINSDQWHLVTGEQEELYKMGRLAYFADEGFGKGVTELDDFLHTENIVLVDQKRRIRGIYNGTLKLEMQRMMEDIRYLLGE
ncbi:SCO family protein [Ekhidna sp.]|uniref:SCO family protein n=1 Tax=Ekhidna sp. TaxID=2608089 RepID=UPI003B59572D